MAGPDLSVVIVGLHGEASLGPALNALRDQTIADRIEVVAVMPAGHAAPASEPFTGMSAVALANGATTGEAIATGVRAASAQVVAYVEEHSWPRPDWAEHLLDAHDGRVGAVSWAPENANPDSATSWIHLLSDFGPAVHPSPSRTAVTLPWHHTSYRRELLAAYGADLASMLEAEWRVHADIERAGHPLVHCGEARSRHWNVSRYWFHIATEFRGAWSFGASRVEDGRWGLGRRLAYALAAPAVFAIRLKRVMVDLRRVGRSRSKRIVAGLVVSLAAAAVGEAWGYARGKGSSRHVRMKIELDRRIGLNRPDRRRWDRERQP